jgi:hypothetical protein
MNNAEKFMAEQFSLGYIARLFQFIIYIADQKRIADHSDWVEELKKNNHKWNITERAEHVRTMCKIGDFLNTSLQRIALLDCIDFDSLYVEVNDLKDKWFEVDAILFDVTWRLATDVHDLKTESQKHKVQTGITDLLLQIEKINSQITVP